MGRGHGRKRPWRRKDLHHYATRVLPPSVASENWEGAGRVGKLEKYSGFEALGLWGGYLARQPCVSSSGRLDTRIRGRQRGNNLGLCLPRKLTPGVQHWVPKEPIRL